MFERQITILVVDDDEGHVELVRRHLGRAGISYPIVTLSNGSEALDYVFARGAHAGRAGNGELLILLDINMPGLNGVEVLRQIKSDPKTKAILVIILTTSDEPRDINRCYELGCSVYVTKPVDPAAFIEAVRRMGLFISIVSIPIDPARLR
jgi:CheY-like chemotaxis protein